jgi:thymidylate synthase
MDVTAQPAAEMREMLHVNLSADIPSENPGYLADLVRPNMPWAEDHFQERVCGYPINPGIQWANWPWGTNAEKSLNSKGMFNHNYMERYWPKYAGESSSVHTVTPQDWREEMRAGYNPTHGIRHDYGDLGDLVKHLAEEPDTRQAYLPVWFPEDTGIAHDGRKPCTLGYHFIMRNGKLDVVYYLRSCDFAHHFRDDVYLTIRLLQWILLECRKLNPAWHDVRPGKLVMQISSLHMFINDFRKAYP